MEEVVKFIKECGTYYLGTVVDNKPDIRPFGTINIYDGKIYIQTSKTKKVYKQIKDNPNINICAMHEGKWIRLQAIAVEDERIDAEKSMLDAYPNLKEMYTAGDGNTVVFYLKNVSAKLCSFTESEKTYIF